MKDTIFIYALSDPRTKAVRYVGKTQNLKRRLKGHMAHQRNEGMRIWIEDLRTAGLKPSITVIEECPLCDGDEREIFHIAEYRKAGPLLNCGNGGNGVGKHSAETKAKISRSNKVAKSCPKFRKAASERMKSLRNWPEFAELVRKRLSKAVLQLCMHTGKELARYPSIVRAEAAAGCNPGRLTKAIRQGRAYGGFRWVYANAALQATCAPWVPPHEVKARQAAAVSERRRKPVLQLSLDGDRVIAEFSSATAAASAVGVPKSAIWNAAKQQGTSAGFRWKYCEKPAVQNPSPPKNCLGEPPQTQSPARP